MRRVIFYFLAFNLTFIAGSSLTASLDLYTDVQRLHFRVAHEATLRNDLFEMRRCIDRYAADTGRLPQSLEDLASAGCLTEVPVDAITRKKDWVVVTGDDWSGPEGWVGIKDVRSAARNTGLDGTNYSQW